MMKKIIDYFVDNSIIVNLLTVLIVLMGMISIFSLNKETFPNVDFNFITVRTIYQGAAAEDVEKLITIEVERELKEVRGIEEMNAMSAEGASIVSLKVDPDYDTDEVLDEVRNALSDISQKVPSDSEAPIITKATNSDRPLMTTGIYGKPEEELRIDAKFVRDELERIKEISEVGLDGFRDEQFDIQVSTEKLEQYELTLTQILNAIRDRQVNITAGNLKLDGREKLVRTLKENETVASLEEIVVLSNDIGNAVRVKDVATVSRILKDRTYDSRSNGKFAIFLSIKAKSNADVIKTTDKIKERLNAIAEDRNFKVHTFNDMSFYVKRRLGVLTQNGIQGIILVIICLIFFMNLRVSLITAMGAPFAFLVAFALMDSFGITINLISMFGLILVLGMLVDDSIIVAEQYYQNLEDDMEPRAAAKKAAYDTLAPVTSTVLTTMVAFGSLFYMQGIMGKFLWPVPAVVIICLIASWFECFILLPGHLADFAGKTKNIEKTRWYQPLQNLYEKTLKFCLKNTILTVSTFTILLALAVVTAKNMRFELFPADDVTYAYLNIKGPVGSPFEKTNDLLMQIEKVIQSEIKDHEMKGMRTITGFQWSKGATPRIGSHYGTVFVELTMQDFRERKTDEILKKTSEKVKPLVGEYTFSLEKIKNGPPSGKPINVELSGDNLQTLIGLSEQVKLKLDSFKEMISTEIDYENGKRQVIVDINESEARRLGVTNIQIAMELRNAFEGIVATTLKKSDDDVEVLVRLQESERSTEETLSSIKILNNQGQRIPLINMATFKEVDGAFIIRRLDRKRTISISGEVDRLISTSKEMNTNIKPYLDELISQNPGVSYMLTGENRDSNDSLDSFVKALIASVFIIFIILVIQFSSMAQPIIIMTAVPFGFIGVVLAFIIFGLPIGFMALMGMLGLVGVVINDSIVLVTYINRYLTEDFHIRSIIKASLSRFRPVKLTTFTTVVGLLPVAHMPGGDPFLKPMATSFAYGLLFSTTITLIFVPTCYLIYMRILEKTSRGKRLV
mgnify:CR=1 FL=1